MVKKVRPNQSKAERYLRRVVNPEVLRRTPLSSGIVIAFVAVTVQKQHTCQRAPTDFCEHAVRE